MIKFYTVDSFIQLEDADLHQVTVKHPGRAKNQVIAITKNNDELVLATFTNQNAAFTMLYSIMKRLRYTQYRDSDGNINIEIVSVDT